MAGWERIDAQSLITITPQVVTGGYTLIAQANSFNELNQKLAQNPARLNSGDKVRFIIQLREPVAPAFNLAGAELIFRSRMPEGLVLDDIRGEGWTTVVIEAHATSPWLAAIGAFLAANWQWLVLAAIGIAVALGLLMASVAFLVLSVKSPETIAETAKWVALGVGGLALFGLIAYGATRKKKLKEVAA